MGWIIYKEPDCECRSAVLKINMSAIFLKLPIFLYAAVKECITRLKLVKDQSDIIVILSIFISVVLLIPIVLILLILAIYRTAIDMYLKNVHKENYRGLMEGIDAICCHQENCVPTLVACVEFNNNLEELKQAVVKQIQSVMSTKHHKLFYSRGEFMGYHYYFKENIPAENYISIMETNDSYIDKRKFSEMFLPYNKAPMPCNDRKLLQVVICPQPVQTDEYTVENIYNVIYRVHHCVGDGKSVLHLFRGVFADNECKIIRQAELNGKGKKTKLALKKVKKFMTNVTIKDFPMSVTDRNCLRGYALTEDKYIVWFSDQGTTYMDKIRNLRRSINGVTFLDVINTCLASSLYDYCEKRALKIPKTVLGGVVLATEATNFSTYGSLDFELKNRFSAAGFRLPISVDFDEGNKLMARFKFLNKEYEIVRRSLDIQFNYFCVQNITNLVPSQIMRFLSRYIEITIGISSLPGCDGFTFFGGHEVKDILLLPPNSPGTGLHIIIFTYKGHLRIGFTADKSVMPRYEDAKEVVHGLLAHLDELSALCSSEGYTSL